MGYPSLGEVINSVKRMSKAKSQGLWQVLFFLRHRRLNGEKEEYTFDSYDLAQACFDLNGIDLPIENDSRNVYFEPAPKNSSKSSFRHFEGPRQTYLNRIQTGLSGLGKRQPNLFIVNRKDLPITAKLQMDWIEELRGIPGNKTLLDDYLDDLLTWIFRFGLPVEKGTTAYITKRGERAELRLNPNIELLSLSSSPTKIRSAVEDYLGLNQEQLGKLMPNLLHLQNRLGFEENEMWSQDAPITFQELGREMRNTFLMHETSGSDPIYEAPEMTTVDSYVLDWERFNSTGMKEDNLPLVGVEKALASSIAALRAGKFVILIGNPGTGKTRLARYLVSLATKNGAPGFIIATATSEWSTFETLGGYMPSRDNSGLEFTSRLVVDSLATGKWLIIDEINRADIDKAFGELFTLFSGEEVRLPVQDKSGRVIVLVPPNRIVEDEDVFPIYQQPHWRMIGTMNSFDKSSLYQLSYAFMRRFAFVNVPVPDIEQYQEILRSESKAIMSALNDDKYNSQAKEAVDNLIALFCPENESLGKIGLRVGPAIPLDILKYVTQRLVGALELQEELDFKETVLEGLEMYLFPQFEGRDSHHEEILEIFRVIFKLDSAKSRQLGTNLSLWTGYESASS